MVAEGYTQSSKFLHDVKLSAIIVEHWRVGVKESHDFALVHI